MTPDHHPDRTDVPLVERAELRPHDALTLLNRRVQATTSAGLLREGEFGTIVSLAVVVQWDRKGPRVEPSATVRRDTFHLREIGHGIRFVDDNRPAWM